MKVWGENSPCYEMDNLVIHNHRQLFITLLVCTRDFIETVWDFAFIPWRANFLSRMPQKFWQLVVLLLPLQEMNELMGTEKRNCLLFPWRLGRKLVVSLMGQEDEPCHGISGFPTAISLDLSSSVFLEKLTSPFLISHPGQN